jgi:23S rRNA (adenine(2503)-C(2))-methyltransferase
MAPKRKECASLSIWDDGSLTEVLSVKHAIKLWNWLARNPEKSLEDALQQEWVVNRVPREAARQIREKFVLSTSRIVEKYESNRGDTTKLLVELHDGHRVETVVMKHEKRTTVCVSSQIGCQMGCKFCATGTLGIIGDLTSAEILEQLMHANRVTKIRNVVFMGMGEPLNNFENVKKSIEFMVDEKRFGLAPRHVTVSTVGVVRNMKRLTDEVPQVNLALSLHAPNQSVRVQIVPAATAHKIEKLMDAVDYHITQGVSTCRQEGKVSHLERWYGVMIEYILIQDVNDREEHAHELAALLSANSLRRKHTILNLIPYNPTEVAESYNPPTKESVERFSRICMSEPYNIMTRVRKEMGQDIAGACGQLALVAVQSQKDENGGNGSGKGTGNGYSSGSSDGTGRVTAVVDVEDVGIPPKAQKNTTTGVLIATDTGSSSRSRSGSSPEPIPMSSNQSVSTNSVCGSGEEACCRTGTTTPAATSSSTFEGQDTKGTCGLSETVSSTVVSSTGKNVDGRESTIGVISETRRDNDERMSGYGPSIDTRPCERANATAVSLLVTSIFAVVAFLTY